MGHRTVKRVPMDFAHPINETWPGFVNPHYRECPHCEGGYSHEYTWIRPLIHRLLMIGEAAERWNGRLHPYLLEMGYKNERPPEGMAVLCRGLAGTSPSDLFGYMGCGAELTAIEKVMQAAGLPEDATTCKHCKGEGIDPEIAEAYEAWKEYEPPTGEGWQLWETCSEGSPVSPVFATAEELAAWCVTGATIFADIRSTYEEWLGMFKGGEDAVEMGSMFIVDTRRGVMGAAVHVLEKGDS